MSRPSRHSPAAPDTAVDKGPTRFQRAYHAWRKALAEKAARKEASAPQKKPASPQGRTGFICPICEVPVVKLRKHIRQRHASVLANAAEPSAALAAYLSSAKTLSAHATAKLTGSVSKRRKKAGVANPRVSWGKGLRRSGKIQVVQGGAPQ